MKEAPVSDYAGAFDLSLCHRDLFIFRKRVVWGKRYCLPGGRNLHGGDTDDARACIPVFRKGRGCENDSLQSIKQRTWNSIPCDAIVECWNHVFKLRNGPGRKCSPWYGTQLPGTVFEQSALCGLCPECNISGSGNVPSAHGADGTASGMCDLTGGHLSGFLLHRHSGPDGYPGQRLEGTGQRDGTHFAGGSVGNCIFVYTVPPFSFSRIR